MKSCLPLKNRVFLALIGALVVVQPTSAEMLRTSVVNDVNDLGGPSPTRVERIGEALIGPLADSMSTTVGDATGTTSVTVDYGYAHVTGSADVSAFGTASFSRIANGSTQGRWDDDITIDAPGLSGQFFTISFLMEFSGSLFSSVIQPPGGASATSSWGGSLSLGNLLLIGFSGRHSESFGSNFIVDSTFGIMESRRIPFQMGVPFTLTFRLNGSAGAISGYTASAANSSTDISAKWLGFGEILDANGLPVSNLTTVSASGFNYSQAYSAVPIPAAAWLFGSAILSVGVVRRRPAKKETRKRARPSLSI